jgi:hypothetical protein
MSKPIHVKNQPLVILWIWFKPTLNQIDKINANALNVSFIKMLKNVGTFITQRHYNVPKNNKNASWDLMFSFIVFKKVSTHSQSLS